MGYRTSRRHLQETTERQGHGEFWSILPTSVKRIVSINNFYEGGLAWSFPSISVISISFLCLTSVSSFSRRESWNLRSSSRLSHLFSSPELLSCSLSRARLASSSR